jgi:hypothetical protein
MVSRSHRPVIEQEGLMCKGLWAPYSAHRVVPVSMRLTDALDKTDDRVAVMLLYLPIPDGWVCRQASCGAVGHHQR